MHQDQNLYCGRSALHNVSGFIDEFREKSLHGLVSLLGAKLSLHLMHNINWSNWPAALVTIERGDKESPEGRNSETVNWLQLPPPSSYCRITMQRPAITIAMHARHTSTATVYLDANVNCKYLLLCWCTWVLLKEHFLSCKAGDWVSRLWYFLNFPTKPPLFLIFLHFYSCQWWALSAN